MTREKYDAVMALSAKVPIPVAGHYKPEPQPYQMALDRLGCGA